MKWIKKALVFSPASVNSNFIKSHSQIPTVLVLDDRLRVYYATRPSVGLSMTTYIDLDIKNPEKILYVHDKPILELGSDGMFDEHGIMPNFVYKVSNSVFMQYVGWSRRKSIPYSNWMGLAQSFDDGKTFHKLSDVPFLDRCKGEYLSATGTFQLYKNDTFHLFYAKGTNWIDVNDTMESQYNIVKAISNDGVHWSRDGKEIFPRLHQNEASTRPSIIYRNNKYHMWFCYRDVYDYRDGVGSYRMGYASSNDLFTWHRDDKSAGIDVSSEGWDSKMIAYPYIVETQYGIYMFYNGNGFGKSGFGYAILEE